MRLSLRGRLLVFLVGLVVLTAALISGLAIQNASRTVETRVQAQLNAVADLERTLLTSWFAERTADVHLLADNFLNEEHFTIIIDPSADPALASAFSGFLTDNILSIQNSREGYREIFFVDSNGRVVLSTDAGHIGASESGLPVVSRTLASPDGTHVEDIYRAPDGRVLMGFGHVLRAVDPASQKVTDVVNGAVIILVDMQSTIFPMLQDWPGQGESGEAFLVRVEGEEVLYLSPLRFADDAALNLRLDRVALAEAQTIESDGLFETSDYRGSRVLAAVRRVPDTGWTFIVKQDLNEAFTPVTNLTRQLIFLTLVVSLVAGVTGVVLSQALTQPLDRLVEAAERVAGGDYRTEITVSRADEIGALANTLRMMLGTVQQNHADLLSHSQNLQALLGLSQSFLGTLSVSTTLQSALRQAMSVIHADAGAVLLTDTFVQRLTVREVVGLPSSLMGQSFPIDAHTASGFALLAGGPIYTDDLNLETRFRVPPILQDLGVRSVLAVPMLKENHALGAVVLHSHAPRGYTEDQIRLTQSVANQAALALERARLFRDLADSYDRTLDALVAALDARDKETEGHSQRVVAYTLVLARALGVPEEQLSLLRRGALLHDVGKIGVADSILRKPGPLDEEEWGLMRLHPELGERILAGIRFLEGSVDVVIAHHERWDGTGYPRRLRAEEIPLGARIFAVADALDAITSDRPYRRAQPFEVAYREIVAGSGGQFDPRVVAAFVEIPEEQWERIRAEVDATTFMASIPADDLSPSSLQDGSPELFALQQLLRSVSGKLDLNEVLHQAVDTIVDKMQAAAAGLFLYEPDTDSLTLAAHRGMPAPLVSRFGRFPVRGFHNEDVVRLSRPRMHGSVAEIPAFVKLGLPESHPDWGTYLCVPLATDDGLAGIMGVFSRRPRLFTQRDLGLYHALGGQIGQAIANAKLHETVQRQAITDSLTGAYNRHYLQGFLANELERCLRFQSLLSLILLDIDDFKAYNIAHGRPAGDEALRQFTDLLRENLRGVDLVARYGGEEFAIVLPETDHAGARVVADKLRQLVEGHPFPYGALTISLGIATCDAETARTATVDTLIGRAAEALDDAMRDGRNQYSVWSEEPVTIPQSSRSTA